MFGCLSLRLRLSSTNFTDLLPVAKAIGSAIIREYTFLPCHVFPLLHGVDDLTMIPLWDSKVNLFGGNL